MKSFYGFLGLITISICFQKKVVSSSFYLILFQESHSTFRVNLIQATSPHQESIEDLIHVLAIILDQARDLYVNNFHAKSWLELDRDLTTYR